MWGIRPQLFAVILFLGALGIFALHQGEAAFALIDSIVIGMVAIANKLADETVMQLEQTVQ